jgi:hypothetical protein
VRNGQANPSGKDSPTKKKNSSCSRREFLGKAAGLTFAGAAAMPILCRCGQEGRHPAEESAALPVELRGRVVLLERPEILDGRGRLVRSGGDGTSSATDAEAMLCDAMAALTGKESLAEALGSIFSPGERVGIKLNCLAGRGLSPQPPLVHALVDGLAAAGIARENILVFERSERELREAGFPVRRNKTGPRFLGNDSPGMGYERTPLLHKSIGSCFCRILTREIDGLINFGVLKDHNLAGLSVGLKNLFGLIHNPNKYHENNCDPFVAHTLEAPPVLARLRLTLCDGMVAQYQGGPALLKKFTWKPGVFLASRDPVAIDAVGGTIIEGKRKAEGLPSLADDGRAPVYIETAAACGLGEARLEKIDVLRP